MLPFIRKVPAKQVIKSKPNPLGAKIFVRCSSDGIAHDFKVYPGKGTGIDREYSYLGLGGAFYPTSKDTRNHIQESLRQGCCTNRDEENVVKLVPALEEESTSKVLFWPYCYTNEAKTTIPDADDDQTNVEETLAKQCDRTLLFCYKSRSTAQLLKQYGNNVTCLHATNKSTDYSLPLLYLVVKTPTNYMVAGVFVVQYETTACISEELSVFKSWNPEYLLKYFMVDFCQAEASSLSEVFPQSEVMLCDFHREQVWERWMKKENDVPPDQKDALLGLSHKIADSSSRVEFDEASKRVKNSVFWRNVKVASYFETHWMPAAKVWVQYHRIINNGTETQNRILKEYYLKWSHGRNLSSLITVVVKKLLPERQSVFIPQNVESVSPLHSLHNTERLRTFSDELQTGIHSLEALGVVSVTYGVLLWTVIWKSIPSMRIAFHRVMPREQVVLHGSYDRKSARGLTESTAPAFRISAHTVPRMSFVLVEG
ncbi:hypothetical protein HPB50_008190 [Hyalomma asiaticum]|uniref:Uncharacterized protein n=1 Tax=Hyalomma asiaticum TaxID=266040 RepID=A0ACB7SEY8_HYAAI|nr:hypothetical protein HPB50_008190 [Hyalomma asiaticum]